MKAKICIAQINYDSSNVSRHINRIKEIILNNRKSDLIVFPELLLHGHPSVERPEGLLYRKIKQFYRTLANESDDLYNFVRKNNARVIIGELKGRSDRFYNAATYIDRDTTESYVKTHVHWTEHFEPGRTLKVFRSPMGKIGINICFDGAFTEVWRSLALKGASIIVNISAVPKTFPVEYMWLRMKAAALNNQVFVVYANRPGDFFSGHSAVFSPRGEPLVSAKSKENIFYADIDLNDILKWRSEEQIYQNRRPLLYREINNHPTKRNRLTKNNSLKKKGGSK